MNRFVLSIVLGASFFAPAFARAADDAPKRPTQIFVHMSGDHATLFGDTSTGRQVACEAPCDRKVPADAEYRVLGGTGTSAPFTLHRDERRLDLAVDGTTGKRGAGIALTVLGAVGTLAGASIFTFGAIDHYSVGATGYATYGGAAFWPTATNLGPDKSAMIVGGAIVGGSLIALAAGLVIFATTHETRVVQTALAF